MEIVGVIIFDCEREEMGLCCRKILSQTSVYRMSSVYRMYQENLMQDAKIMKCTSFIRLAQSTNFLCRSMKTQKICPHVFRQGHENGPSICERGGKRIESALLYVCMYICTHTRKLDTHTPIYIHTKGKSR